MRHWLFHPLIFYPLVALAAVLVIGISLKPQGLPHDPAPVTPPVVEGALVIEGTAFNSPDDSPEQHMTVARDFWGRAQTLRIAVLPNMPPPTPAETGARVLLTPESAALIDDKPVTVEIAYSPMAFNAASGLAVSLQGIGPAEWVIRPLDPQPGTVRFELPAQFAVNAIGLRAMTTGSDQAYGVEITRIRVMPHPG